jgi:hypothetical protein
MLIVGSASIKSTSEQIPVVNAIARLVDRGENFVLWGEHTEKVLQAAQWLAWKFVRMEESGRLENVGTPCQVLSDTDDDGLTPLFEAVSA